MIKNAFRNIKIVALLLAIIASQAVIAPLAHAASYLTLNSFSGHPGETITVSGGGWATSGNLSIYFGSTTGTPAASAPLSNNGEFSATVQIPVNAAPGSLAIIGVDPSNMQSSNAYYVNPLQADISVTAASHAPFATISVDGAGYAPNEMVAVTLASATTTVKANASGSFTGATLVVPNVASGLYTVRGIGQSSGAASTDYLHYFWIDGFYPSASPSTYYALPGQLLSFTGSGFAPNETISVTALGTTSVLSTFTADNTGAFMNAGSFALPVAFHGATQTYTLTGAQSKVSASTGMTVGDFYGFASPSAYWALPTDAISFTGGGFAANETIAIFRGNQTTPITTFTADAEGMFTLAGSVNLPADAAGTSASYTLVGLTSGAKSGSVSVSVGSFYPSISPSEYYVTANSAITVSGTGFAPNESVVVSVTGTTTIATTTANKAGAISTSVTVPYAGKNSATVSATGVVSKATATVGITMATFYPTVTPSAYYAFPGDAIAFTGSGFVPGQPVTITSNEAFIATTVADSFGKISSASTTIPFSATGSITFTFTGYVNQLVSSTIALGTRYSYLSSDIYYASPFSTINVSGNGFGPGETVNVTAGTFSTTTLADASGNTSLVAIPVAPSATGSVTVSFVGASSNTSANLAIGIAPVALTISPDTYYTRPGTTVNFTGTGFTSGEQIAVTLNGKALTTVTTGNAGQLNAYIKIPVSAAKEGSTATFVFTGERTATPIIVPITLAQFYGGIQLSTYYAQAGSPLSITGTGFAPGETVSIGSKGDKNASTTADQNGAFTYNSSVPFAPAGDIKIYAIGSDSSIVAESPITIAPTYTSFQLGSYAGAPGTDVALIGSGYLPFEPVVFTTDRTASTSSFTLMADAQGNFRHNNYVIPADFVEGNLAITATSAHSFTTHTITFYVTGK